MILIVNQEGRIDSSSNGREVWSINITTNGFFFTATHHMYGLMLFSYPVLATHHALHTTFMESSQSLDHPYDDELRRIILQFIVCLVLCIYKILMELLILENLASFKNFTKNKVNLHIKKENSLQSTQSCTCTIQATATQ
jgi:hypothetical protein